MKVLFLCMRTIFEENERDKKHTTGYGYMVRDIAESVARQGISVDLFAISNKKHLTEYQKIRLIPRNWKDCFFNLRPYYFFKAVRAIRNYKPPFHTSLHVFYYYLWDGYIEKCIKKGAYDIIHIQGFDYCGFAYADCCERLGVKYILTFHALTSFHEELQKPPGIKRLERDFLKHAKNKGIPVTAISTGMMNKIKDFLMADDSDTNFYIVPNGTKGSPAFQSESNINIRSEYTMQNNQKIILCVGNICQGKNQLQIIHAVKHLSKEVRDKICILLLGRNLLDVDLNQEINRLGLSHCFRVCGNISKEQIGNYYAQADYTIMASIAEGFGLSVIEGFAYGLPNLCFADLEAVQDLFDANAMLTVTSRTDKALADGILKLLEKKWDKETIKRHAGNFSLEKMAAQYIAVYAEQINKENTGNR